MKHSPNIPGYEITRELGEGTTAVVWLARQTSLDREVAIKVLKPEFVHQIDEVDAFLTEARSVAKLKTRHIIQVFDVGQTDDSVYIVMEYADGHTLAELLRTEGRMPPLHALQIAAAVADAMTDAWQNENMIHRDIKPDNIIIETDGGVKLADLGLARIAGQCTEGEIAGTPNYMSPEQARGSARLTFASDMYSLGATLYHMLTGQAPFYGMPIKDVLEAQQSDQLSPIESFSSQTPRSCRQLVCRLMAKKPHDRYPEWSRLRDDLLKLVDGRLLMIKCPPPGASTLPSPNQETNATASPKAIKFKKQPGRSRMVPPRAAKHTTPNVLQKWVPILQIVLGAALIWFLLGQPWLDARRSAQRQAPDTPAASTPTPEPDNAPVATNDEWNQQTEEDLASDNASDADWNATNSDNPDQEEPAEESIPSALKNDIIDQLAQGASQAARTRWAQWKQEHDRYSLLPETKDITALLAAENQPEALIGEVLAQNTKREFTLEIGGAEALITPERIKGTTVEAMVRRTSGGSTIIRPIQFPIHSLSSENQLSLLRMSDNRMLPYARTILALQQADYASALSRAETGGPLSEAIARFAQQRLDRLLGEN